MLGCTVDGAPIIKEVNPISSAEERLREQEVAGSMPAWGIRRSSWFQILVRKPEFSPMHFPLWEDMFMELNSGLCTRAVWLTEQCKKTPKLQDVTWKVTGFRGQSILTAYRGSRVMPLDEQHRLELRLGGNAPA